MKPFVILILSLGTLGFSVSSMTSSAYASTASMATELDQQSVSVYQPPRRGDRSGQQGRNRFDSQPTDLVIAL